MNNVMVRLSSIQDVRSFVDIVTKYNMDIDLSSGRYVVDAKSIMGIFSLDLLNPIKLSATFKSVKHTTISKMTIKRYIDYLEDAFLIDSAIRYDIKGKKYIDTPSKYYFTDLGLRNARLNL